MKQEILILLLIVLLVSGCCHTEYKYTDQNGTEIICARIQSNTFNPGVELSYCDNNRVYYDVTTHEIIRICD